MQLESACGVYSYEPPDLMRRLSTPKRRKYFFKAWVTAILSAGLLVLLLALFMVRFFFVQSSSMEKSLFPGDFVFVNKLSYGARLPQHPLSVPYSKEYFIHSIQLPYARFPGLSDVEHNDILTFNHPLKKTALPVDKRPVYMKRCVGLPGDTFQIKDKTVFINGRELPSPPTLKFNHHVKATHNNTILPVLEQLGVNDAGRLSNKGDWLVPLTRDEAELLEDHPAIIFVEEWDDEDNTFRKAIFPHNPEHSWNLDDWGPVVIPAKGDTVRLDHRNISLYKKVIEVHEGHRVTLTDSLLLIDGKPDSLYTFEMDHFIVLGDDRHNSKDSRFWGFVPEDHVIGTAGFVLFSYDKNESGWWNKVEWHRFFHPL